ncbi:hypothetical protein [Prochlorococcus sp. MIT 1307]|uniref:hypothetical protein n=1 Tax=Prochlorococcus sp. MIT 1307 TaxID=3096219 RepID=UPI002A756982|nr:hypothetical protein [Prochlorococcus sp. MIT 1307]
MSTQFSPFLPMTKTNFASEPQWFKGSRERGYRGRLYSEKHIPELLRLKKIQDLWDSEENNESIAA